LTHGGGVARPESSTGVIRWPRASFHAGFGEGGGLYLAPDGVFCLDAFTRGHTKNNHATSDHDDNFGSFTSY